MSFSWGPYDLKNFHIIYLEIHIERTIVVQSALPNW